VPLIGFSGSPWTLATYMVEGGSSKEYRHVKGLMFSEPDQMHALLAVIADSVIAYLNAQIEAGAQAVMIFDTWGGSLSAETYQLFSLDYMQQALSQLKREANGRKVPVILFTKGGGVWLEKMANTGCDALGIDWTQDILDARQRVGDKVALQGNMDPGVLYGAPDCIREQVRKILEAFGPNPGHVFNLGHGIHQHVNPDNVKILVDAVHEISREIRAA